MKGHRGFIAAVSNAVLSLSDVDVRALAWALGNTNRSMYTVYLGQLQNGRNVAVKRLHQENSRRLEQFVNEVRIISSVRHRNLVRFFGCCQDRRNLLLVYEYVPNGTLADHLHGEKRRKGLLGWETRLNIALETANALAYLMDTEEISLAHLATSKIQAGALHELVDPDLEFESNPMVRAMVTSVAELAFVISKDHRPSMKEVVTQLQRIKQMGPTHARTC
eukprot:Gb_24016 [translate_table: standard]